MKNAQFYGLHKCCEVETNWEDMEVWGEEQSLLPEGGYSFGNNKCNACGKNVTEDEIGIPEGYTWTPFGLKVEEIK